MSFIKDKISLRCKEKKISLKNLAIKVGMTEAGLLRAFKNNSLKVSTLKNICEILEMEPAYLLNEDLEVRAEAYQKLIDELISAIIGITEDYTSFITLLEMYCNSNPKTRKDINNYFDSLFAKNFAKTEEKDRKSLNEKQKRLSSLMGHDSTKKNIPKLFITNETLTETIENIKDHLSHAETFIKIITELDKNFDTSMIESLYEDHINPKIGRKIN